MSFYKIDMLTLMCLTENSIHRIENSESKPIQLFIRFHDIMYKNNLCLGHLQTSTGD